MKKYLGVLIMILVLFVAVATGFAADEKKVEPTMTAASTAAMDNYRIKTGDVLDITVWKNDELNMSVMVDDAGKVDYPFLGILDVGNKTVAEVKTMIAEGLNKDYIVNPKVNIRLNTQSLSFFVFGEIGRPGTYKYESKLDVLKAVTMAGGFTDFASKKVKIIRKDETGKEHEFRVNTSKLTRATANRDEYLIEPGDTIVVERSWL